MYKYEKQFNIPRQGKWGAAVPGLAILPCVKSKQPMQSYCVII